MWRPIHSPKSKYTIPHPYFLNEYLLINTSPVTDLGILVDTHLTFNLHISIIFTKATQRAGVFSVDFDRFTLHLLEKHS